MASSLLRTVFMGSTLVLTSLTDIACAETTLAAGALNSADPYAVTAINAEFGIRCDTCTSPESFVASALSTYPRAKASTAYVINLNAGVIRAVSLDWDPETHQQLGGYEESVDPLLATWIAQAGQVYRDNGYSLNLKLVVRGDGSVYWVRANGTTEELKDPDAGLAAAVGSAQSVAQTDGAIQVNDAPPNSAPIDLRGYQFNEPAFTNQYPTFPRTTYDFAFNQTTNINNFVRDKTANVQYGAATGVMNGTISAGTNQGVTAIASLSGGTTVTAALSSSVSVYVPMKDGGFVLVQYDKKTGIVTVSEIQDGQGNIFPNSRPAPQNFLPGNPLTFVATAPNGGTAFHAFHDWALRNGIPVSYTSPWAAQTCISRWTGDQSGGTVTCIHPQ